MGAQVASLSPLQAASATAAPPPTLFRTVSLTFSVASARAAAMAAAWELRLDAEVAARGALNSNFHLCRRPTCAVI